jgi:hypothetical protein
MKSEGELKKTALTYHKRSGSTTANFRGKIYLQPAWLSLRAYIFPISPMPMMPTTNPSIGPITFVDVIVAA